MAQRFLSFYSFFGFMLWAAGCEILFQVNSQTPPCSAKLCDDAVSTIKELNNKITDLQNELVTIKKHVSYNEGNKNLLTVTSCADAMRQPYGKYTASGVYELYLPEFFPHTFQVYCLQDPEGGEAWTIIQRRQSNETDFYRDWVDYEHGFGDLGANFFLGLDKIHALTQSRPHELWIHLEDFKNEIRFAKYNSFAIGNANEKYALNQLGNFNGTAGDSLRYQKGRKFSTRDSDNEKNCAKICSGAWWYNYCHHSNLNGLYLSEAYGEELFGRGVVWITWHGQLYSLKHVHMAIRPKSFGFS